MFVKKPSICFFGFFLLICLFQINFANSSIVVKKISKEKFFELNDLIVNKKYYDFRRNKENKIFNLMYYAISNDGKYSSFSICDTHRFNRYDCVDYLEKVKTQKGCERIARQKCFILISNEYLVINNHRIELKKIENESILNSEITKLNIEIEYSNQILNKPLIIYTKSFNFDLDE